MLTAAQSLAGLEKSGLHPLVVGSPNVIDLEISLRAAHAQPDQPPSGQDGNRTTKSQNRLDAATLEQRGNHIFVVFHEAKHFSNPGLAAKVGKIPKVIEQIRDYRSTIKHHEASLAERYHSVCRTLLRLNAMRQQVQKSAVLDSLIQEAGQKRVELRIDPIRD
jgi:hypothetical protein